MLKSGVKVQVLRGTWAGQAGVILPTKDNSPFHATMKLIGGVQVELEGGKVVQLLENNLKPI